MTDKQKLVLKIVLFVTFPVWFPLAVIAVLAAMPFVLIWLMVDGIVDPPPRYMSGKRVP